MTTTVTTYDDLERKMTIARLCLDRAADDLAEIETQLLPDKEFDRADLQARASNAAYLVYIAKEELEELPGS